VKKCIANDRDGWDNTFADALALSGDTLVVGARRDTTGGVGCHGSAYVCYRNQGGADNWGVVKKIRPADNSYNDYFATSVALSGDTLAAGAPSHGGLGTAYLFYRNSGGTDNWGQVKELAYAGGSSMPRFGMSVALFNETLAVGAPLDDLGTGWQGSVYIFYRDQGGTDNWGGAGKLVDREGVGGDYFGWRLSLIADTLLVGAYGDTYSSRFGWGSICAFARNQGGLDSWGQTIKLVPADGVASGSFGSAVGFDGTMILVGASGDTVGSNAFQGSVYALKL
jgi:hypothetical protein